MKTRARAKTLKMALIGTQRVGKTSLLTKFHFGNFEKNTIATVGASFILHTFKINDADVSFQIWDTAGQERYRSLAPIYYRDALCAIAVFDLTLPNTFDEMKIYVDQFKQHCSDYYHIAIVGNKLDLVPQAGSVDVQAIEKWAKSEGFSFHKTSASTGEGVSETFQHIAETVANKMSNQSVNEAVDLEETTEKKKCC